MKNVLITGARAPIALDLAHSFAAAGFVPHLADCITPYAALFSKITRGHLHRFASPRYRFEEFTHDLAALVQRLKPALIIPTCEEVFYVAAAASRLGISDIVFAPPMETLKKLHSKVEFSLLAQSCGCATPTTRRVTTVEELGIWHSLSKTLVFKPEFSRFATNTFIRPEPNKLKQILPTPDQPWAVQDFVEGEEFCLWSGAIKGSLVAYAAYRPRWRLNRSASFYFEPVDDPALQALCATIARATNATGQLSFDVIRRPDGSIAPLECNPRGVSGIHLYGANPNLARALVGGAFAAPESGPKHLALAMWLLGAPQALANGQWPEFRRDLRRSKDALALPGSRLTWLGALADAARFALGGLANRRSAAGASTDDIEWNGEVIG